MAANPHAPRRPRRFDRNLIVIGAGAGGLVAAYLGAALRARVTLIERGRMGGDCLNSGCVPSKALIHAAAAGLDFAAAKARIEAAITAIAPHDSIARYESLGVDVRVGEARLLDPWRVAIGGEILTTRAIVIAAGAAPVIPPLPGLAEAPFVTSETLWDLADLPRRLVILGGGPIGCELAQAFARLGTAVTLVEQAPSLLSREDDEVSALLAKAMARQGITLLTGHRALAVTREGEGFALRIEGGGGPREIVFDRLLLAIGRKPQVDGYGLEEIGVRLTARGTVATNPWLQTNYPHILACGDVAGPWQFTHIAGHQGGIAALNGLFGWLWRLRPETRAVPAVTFTSPEIARVGLNEREARDKGIGYEVTRYDLAELDRALIEGESEGFVKILTPPGRDRLLGVTIVGHGAGEMLAPATLALRHRLGLRKILATIQPYPTRSEALRAAAGLWRQNHASPRALAWLARLHAWRRGGEG